MPRRVLEGKVVGSKCDKTVTVKVERRVKDPMYGKVIRRSAKYAAHDEANQWNVGDKVTIEECRPISKSKKWRVTSGAASGESQAKTIDDTNEKNVSVKKGPAKKTEAKED